MNNRNTFINRSAFDELCKYVCWQMQLSGSEQKDRETINFAIYWQVCSVFDKKVEFTNGLSSKTATYQKLVQNTIDSQMIDSFDVSEIIDRNILEVFQSHHNDPIDFSIQEVGNSSRNSLNWTKSLLFS